MTKKELEQTIRYAIEKHSEIVDDCLDTLQNSFIDSGVDLGDLEREEELDNLSEALSSEVARYLMGVPADKEGRLIFKETKKQQNQDEVASRQAILLAEMMREHSKKGKGCTTSQMLQMTRASFRLATEEIRKVK